jgi:uncharacterized membrane protein (UPF0127 family)
MSHCLTPLLRTRERCGLQIRRTGSWLAEELEPALDSSRRRAGLLGRDSLPARQGLVIAPSQGVHTFGMRFPIDIVALDRWGRVVKYRQAVGPRRIVLALRAFAFVELAAGTIDRVGLRNDDELVILPRFGG